jgi:hypothetical protein
MLCMIDTDVPRRTFPDARLPAILTSGPPIRRTDEVSGQTEVIVARATEAAAIVGAGAAGAALAVLLIGGSLLLILPAVAVVGLITLVASVRQH